MTSYIVYDDDGYAIKRLDLAGKSHKFFCPDFVEWDGGVFLNEAFDSQIYEQWKAKLGNNIAAIERVMNHQHIDDIFSESDRVGVENLAYLGQVIAQMWEARLKFLYPDRNFEVCCNQDEDSVVVTFCSNLK